MRCNCASFHNWFSPLFHCLQNNGIFLEAYQIFYTLVVLTLEMQPNHFWLFCWRWNVCRKNENVILKSHSPVNRITQPRYMTRFTKGAKASTLLTNTLFCLFKVYYLVWGFNQSFKRKSIIIVLSAVQLIK